MFDRAVRGLTTQGFERSMEASPDGLNDRCAYVTGSGPSLRRCAWGWVDPEGTGGLTGSELGASVTQLRRRCIGLATGLSDSDVAWAARLQQTHDVAADPAEMVRQLRDLAVDTGLSTSALDGCGLAMALLEAS